MYDLAITLAKDAAAASSDATQSAGLLGTLPMILMLALMFVVMYFLLIRPQKKKEKEEKKMRDSLQVGDEIVTIGGIYGRVISLKEDTFVIESKSDHSKLTFGRWALQSVLTVHDDVPAK